MYCPNCGKEISSEAKFCQYCGFKFEQENIYSHSYYKEGYKKSSNSSEQQSYLRTFVNGIITMLVLLICFVGVLFFKNNFMDDMFNISKLQYQQYVEDPSSIPELSQPDSLSGLVSNLKDVQHFLTLYLKVSDDDMDTKLEVFDKYRKELLKLQNFDSTNLLDGNVRYTVPRTQKEFKSIQKQYAKTLSKVGLMIVADESYSKYHLAENAEFTYKKYGKYLSQDIQEYLKLRAKYYQPCMYKDELLVKPYSLAKRIGDYEKFYNAHEDFRYVDELKDLLFSYTFIYTFTSDRTNMIFIRNKSFVKSDKKFISSYPDSQLKTLFTHLAESANGISESQFDSMYPYKYQKGLDAIKPEKAELSDIFSTVRQSFIKLKSDDNFEYTYISSTGTWIKYDASKALKKGDIILAQGADGGYDIYDYKYKKTNQTIQLEPNAKFFIKENQLFAYSPNHLQIMSLESSYGTFSFRTLSVKAIKKIFPDVLIINIDTFGELSVQVDKPAGNKTYILISSSGGNYDDYRLSGNVQIGELSNIFTVSDAPTQVNWAPLNGEGDCYEIHFITRQASTDNNETTAE